MTGKVYIDKDGVRRGYYVYLHKDKETGEVFYIGKGHDKRAWQTTERHSEWQKRVAQIEWEVVIVKDNLSEDEAFDLETELVEQYGGPAALGGRLTNWLPGGEDPASVSLSVELPTKAQTWYQAYREARSFKRLAPQERVAFLKSLESKLWPLEEEFIDIELQEENKENESISEIAAYVSSILYSLIDEARRAKSRRISWKDFGIALEDSIDDLESALEDAGVNSHPDVIAKIKLALSILRKAFIEIDTGNREEAEKRADDLTDRHP